MREPRLITLPRYCDHRGTLSVVEWPEGLPFEPKRFYYLYDLVPGTRRAVHAHAQEEEVLLALSGSLKVLLDDGCTRVVHDLDRPDVALYIPALVWHEVYGFSAGAVCAVFASERRNEKDYIRDYQEFLAARKRNA